MNQILKNDKVRKVEETRQTRRQKGVKAFRTKPYLYALVLLFAFLLLCAVLVGFLHDAVCRGQVCAYGNRAFRRRTLPRKTRNACWIPRALIMNGRPRAVSAPPCRKARSRIRSRPGRTAKYSRSVRLTVSKGIRGVAVPELHGKTSSDGGRSAQSGTRRGRGHRQRFRFCSEGRRHPHGSLSAGAWCVCGRHGHRDRVLRQERIRGWRSCPS